MRARTVANARPESPRLLQLTRSRAAWQMAVLLACALAAGGCASRGLGARMQDELQHEIRARGVDPAQVVIPFTATDEMRRWLAAEVPTSTRRETQLTWLLQALLNRTAAPLTYVAGHTGTAQQVFEDGTANCLGFSQLFVALARELGLPVYLLRVSDLQSFEREGDLIVASAHITAAFGTPDRRRILDFAQRPVRAYRWVEEIGDLTAVALYYSNRGAEELRDGNTAEGLELLRMAVRLDPELAEAWINLGVAERRTGDLVAAETAYRRALEVDPSTTHGLPESLRAAAAGGAGRRGRRAARARRPVAEPQSVQLHRPGRPVAAPRAPRRGRPVLSPRRAPRSDAGREPGGAGPLGARRGQATRGAACPAQGAADRPEELPGRRSRPPAAGLTLLGRTPHDGVQPFSARRSTDAGKGSQSPRRRHCRSTS